MTFEFQRLCDILKGICLLSMNQSGMLYIVGLLAYVVVVVVVLVVVVVGSIVVIMVVVAVLFANQDYGPSWVRSASLSYLQASLFLGHAVCQPHFSTPILTHFHPCTSTPLSTPTSLCAKLTSSYP